MAFLEVDSPIRKYQSHSPTSFSSVRTGPELLSKGLHAIAEVCRAGRSSLPVFTRQVLAAAKEITGATWAELLLLQGHTLMVCPSGADTRVTMKQARQHFDVTTESLAGLVVISGEPKNFTSPHATAYKNSINKLTPFSSITMQPEETWSVAAVPICDSDGTRSGVLMIFNKSEERYPQTFFTSSDVALCKELCEVVGAVIETRKAMEGTKNELQNFQEFLTERSGLISTFIQTFEKKKRLKELFKTMRRCTSELTVELLENLLEVLHVDALLVHTAIGESLEPRIAIGLRLSDYHTNTAAYCAFTTHEPLNIPDVSTEPLLSGLDIPMKSALCYPVIKNHAPVAVFELFRRQGTFSELDMTLLGKTVDAIDHISTKDYERYFDGITGRKARNANVSAISRYLREFYLPRKDEILDYVRLFQATESSLKRLFRANSCSIYLSDESRNLIWTRQSDSCDPLTFLKEESSLLGYLAKKNTPTMFPLDEELMEKEGAQAYARAKGACMPVLGTYMSSEHVLGIILLTRDSPLTAQELLQFRLYAETLSRLLLVLYFDTRYVRTQRARNGEIRRVASFLEVNIEEKVLERARTEGKVYNFTTTEEKRPAAPWVTLIPEITTIPVESLHRIGTLCSGLEASKDPFNDLAMRLTAMLPCEAAALFIYDHYHQNLINKATGVQCVPSGLVKVALVSQAAIIEGPEVVFNRDFYHELDGLGRDEVKNLAIVPILCFGNQPEGVLVFVNVKDTEEEVGVIARIIACIPRDVLIAADSTALNWRNLVQTGRRQKMLFKWCSEIFRVLILSQERTLKCSSILNRLRMSPELSDLMAITLETLALILNVEGAKLIMKRAGAANYYEFTRESGLDEVKGAIPTNVQQVFERGVAVTAGAHEPVHNSLLLPVLLDDRVVSIIHLWNKKDEALNSYTNFGVSDEAVIKDICDQLGAPCQSLVTNEKGEWFPELTAVLQERAWAINNYSLLSTIRRACKTLLGCDRASVFLVEGDRVVIKPQGNDQEIPVGTSIPIGVGIIGSVVQSGKAANLEDAYQDSRFNPSVDMKTGYRTRTVLCVPVIAEGRVIAALQMINKSDGLFDSTDMEILTMFSDLAAGVLQSMQLFQRVIDEKKMYTDMLNGLGCAIVVLKDGMLDFSNRSIEVLLGVSEAYAVSHHYSQWSTLSPTLRSDIDAVEEHLLKTARKKFQLLQNNERHFDYRVIPVDEEGSVQKKLMLVFEEVGIRPAQVSPRRQNRKTTVQPQTILQTCIHTLSELMDKADPDSKSSLDFVVHTLKSGNLNYTKIIVDEEGLTDSIDPEIMQQTPVLSQPRKRRTTEFNLELLEVSSHSSVSLEELRDWNLDFMHVSSEYPYILCMLEDFNLVKDFNINLPAFQNFLAEIKTFYNQRRNPFHNYMHACSVMHNMYCLLTSTAAGRLYDDWELLSLLIGALGHDVDHTGRSNSFEVSKESPLAIRYHDTSVLEQHHAATLFHTFQKPSCSFLPNIDLTMKKNIRKFMIALILSTDLAKHMNMVANMQARFKELSEEPLGSRPNDNREAGELLMHCADLSNPTKSFEITYHWSACLAKEFEAQVKEEQKLNLPVTTFMLDLHKPSVFLKNEVGFYSVIVKPLWECLGEWLSPAIDGHLAQLSENIEILKKMLEETSQG